MSDNRYRMTFIQNCLYGLLICALPILVHGESNSSSEVNAITSGGSRAITSGGSRAITSGGSRLLVYGRIEVLGSDFVSVLGQTVFVGEGEVNRFSLGTSVAVYGSIDIDTGGIVGATVVDAGQAGFTADAPSYLTGIVDAVDYENGNAIVSGMMVDYNALLHALSRSVKHFGPVRQDILTVVNPCVAMPRDILTRHRECGPASSDAGCVST